MAPTASSSCFYLVKLNHIIIIILYLTYISFNFIHSHSVNLPFFFCFQRHACAAAGTVHALAALSAFGITGPTASLTVSGTKGINGRTELEINRRTKQQINRKLKHTGTNDQMILDGRSLTSIAVAIWTHQVAIPQVCHGSRYKVNLHAARMVQGTKCSHHRFHDNNLDNNLYSWSLGFFQRGPNKPPNGESC